MFTKQSLVNIVYFEIVRVKGGEEFMNRWSCLSISLFLLSLLIQPSGDNIANNNNFSLFAFGLSFLLGYGCVVQSQIQWGHGHHSESHWRFGRREGRGTSPCLLVNVFLSYCFFFCLTSISLHVCSSIWLFFCIFLSVLWLSVNLTSLGCCLHVWLSVCLSVCLHVCLFVCLSQRPR